MIDTLEHLLKEKINKFELQNPTMREICFTIQWKEIPTNQDVFIDQMIDFSISNGVSFAGGIEEFCFCVDIGKVIPNPNTLETKCREFLHKTYGDKIATITAKRV
ncbi:hypothetical protein [Kordia sp.]|uniref:hypothetical protein n=1 Tax=Kordia sp. TaxID=1965332 RepID=UPI003B5C2A21